MFIRRNKMKEKIYKPLKLDGRGGLGRRVAVSEVEQDAQDPNLFHILSDDVEETNSLVNALTVCAAEVFHPNMRFTPVRISSPSLEYC